MLKLLVHPMLIAVLCCGYAVAGPIAVGPGAFSGSTVTVDFLAFASVTQISNQLATPANFGLTFSSTLGGIFATSDFAGTTGVATSASSFNVNCPCVDETLTFSSPLMRIGFDLFGSNVGTATFTNNSSGLSVDVAVQEFPARQFIGIEDAGGITSLTIAAPTNLAFVVDTLKLDPVASASPEPGSLALMALGVGGVGFLLRHRVSRRGLAG